MDNNTYVGIIKLESFQTRDNNTFEVMKVSFREEDLRKMLESMNNGWVNLDITKRLAPSDKGITHTCRINTYAKK